MAARVSLYVIAALLIAAHFLRGGDFAGVAFCVATPFLFFVRQRWSLLLLQALAYVAAAVWLVTAWQIAAERLSFGQPWLRAALILVAVAAVSALAGGLLRSRSLHARYGER